jgi:hypothetical protein
MAGFCDWMDAVRRRFRSASEGVQRIAILAPFSGPNNFAGPQIRLAHFAAGRSWDKVQKKYRWTKNCTLRQRRHCKWRGDVRFDCEILVGAVASAPARFCAATASADGDVGTEGHRTRSGFHPANRTHFADGLNDLPNELVLRLFHTLDIHTKYRKGYNAPYSQ